MSTVMAWIRAFVLIWNLFRFDNYGLTCVVDPNVDAVGRGLSLSYKVIENKGSGFTAQLTLTNGGIQAIKRGNWSIYFSHVRLIEPQTIRPNGTVLGSSGLKTHHYNGVLHWIEPTDMFNDLAPGQSLVVPFNASDWQVSRTDVMPHWYVVSSGLDCNDTRLISNTVGQQLDFVSPFVTEVQWKRTPWDLFSPYTPQVRYDEVKVTDRGSSVRYILPTPKSEQFVGGTVNLKTSGFLIVIPSDPSIQNEAKYLAEKLGLGQVPPESVQAGKSINLRIASSQNEADPEAYEIDISATRVNISGNSRSGVYYGVQSLLSLSDGVTDGEVPIGKVVDSPRFQYRGLHVDVSRNFHSIDDLKRLMEVMALYKLNRLHIHLANDEGWRLEIPNIPELTEIGSKRCHDLLNERCLMPQLGSIPTEPNSGSGFYSVSDYRSILSYANDHHIVVVPEFDMPGHAHAAIKAMLARYRKYRDTDLNKATEFLLTDLDDLSDYLSVQYFTDNAINPCLNSTYTFINTVLESVKSMHEDIQPLSLYHIGGDEVATGAWLKSPRCLQLFGSNLTHDRAKEYFVRRISEIVRLQNVTPVAWEDGLVFDGEIRNTTDLFAGPVYTNAWSNVWEWGTGGRAYAFANAGYKVILSHATHLFLDHPAEPDPEERGFYWATRTTSLKKTFSYIPSSIYDNIEMDVGLMGEVLNKSAICATVHSCPPLLSGKEANVVGMQAQLWSETVRTSDELDYMVFPRLLAIAERAWHAADWEGISDVESRKLKREEDWEAFANTIGYKELRRLDQIGVKYRVPPVGVKKLDETEAEVTTGIPGLEIQFKDSEEKSKWTTVEGNRLTLTSGSTVYFRARSANGARYSRVVSFNAGSVSQASRRLMICEHPWIQIIAVAIVLLRVRKL